MNSLVRDHIPATYFPLYQQLRGALLGVLDDADLETRLGGDSLTLGRLCREIGEVQQAYIESFRTFETDFSRHDADPIVERDIAALGAWYARLDADLLAALEALTEDDIAGRPIHRSDGSGLEFSLLPPQQLDIYREALLIFYAKASVYLRAIGTPLPGYWPAWIE